MPINHRDFWDTRHLKSELAAHAVTEGALFFYFLAVTGFDWLQFTVIRLSSFSGTISAWELVDALSSLVFTLGGLVFLFGCNGGTHGKDFLYRYFPLSFVVGWKFMVSLFVVLWLGGRAMPNTPAADMGWASTIISAAFNIAMFLRIGLHMKQLSRVTPA